MHFPWRRLPLSAKGTRPFLYKVEFKSDSYTIHITDFEKFWIESLNRRDVILRAFEVEASIDPSEGAGQMRLLFEHIANALEGKPKTSVTLKSSADECLQLSVTAKLPGSLPSLEWKFLARLSSQTLVTDELILPIFQSIMRLQKETSSLIGQLMDKDRVIEKLLNKLESSGIELNAIFPNVSIKGSRSSAKDAMFKAVKGLSEFEETKWRESSSFGANSDLSLDNVLDAALPFERASKHQSQIDNRDSTTPSTRDPLGLPPKMKERQETLSSDHVSQSQAIPNEGQSQRATLGRVDDGNPLAPNSLNVPASSSDSTSEDSDNLEAGIKPANSSSPMINKSRTSSSSNSEPKASTPNKGKRKLGIVGSKKAAASSSEEDKDLPTKASGTNQPRRFGKIGGRRPPTVTVHQGSQGPSRSISPLPPKSSEKRAEAQSPVLSAVDSGPKLGPPIARVHSAEVQETPEERALRKRQEAKEIESKRAPVKKKRKF